MKERFLAGVAGTTLFVFIILKSYILFLGGVVICAGLIILQWRKKNDLMKIQATLETGNA